MIRRTPCRSSRSCTPTTRWAPSSPSAVLAEVAHVRGARRSTPTRPRSVSGKIRTSVRHLGVDLLTVAGHKMYAPKGIGVLYARDGVELEPVIGGGGQERGRRAGTENTASIVALGAAAGLAASSLGEEPAGVRRLRDRLEAELTARLPGRWDPQRRPRRAAPEHAQRQHRRRRRRRTRSPRSRPWPPRPAPRAALGSAARRRRRSYWRWGLRQPTARRGSDWSFARTLDDEKTMYVSPRPASPTRPRCPQRGTRIATRAASNTWDPNGPSADARSSGTVSPSKRTRASCRTTASRKTAHRGSSAGLRRQVAHRAGRARRGTCRSTRLRCGAPAA